MRTPFDWWGALRARVTIPPQRDHSPEHRLTMLGSTGIHVAAAQGNIKTAFCCPLIIAVPAIWPRLLMSFAAITSFASMVTTPF